MIKQIASVNDCDMVLLSVHINLFFETIEQIRKEKKSGLMWEVIRRQLLQAAQTNNSETCSQLFEGPTHP